MKEKYIVEIRDENGQLIYGEKEEKIRKSHPFLFSKQEFTIDELCYYASYGQGRNTPIGPQRLWEIMDSFGVSYRKKTW